MNITTTFMMEMAVKVAVSRGCDNGVPEARFVVDEPRTIAK